MKTIKSPTMADRVAASLRFELDLGVDHFTGETLSVVEHGAALAAFVAVKLPAPKAPLLSPGFYSAVSMVVAFVAPVASLAGLMFAGLAL